MSKTDDARNAYSRACDDFADGTITLNELTNAARQLAFAQRVDAGGTMWRVTARLVADLDTLAFNAVTPTGRLDEAYQYAGAYLQDLGYAPADYTLTDIRFD
jgi:hypothetical protein